MIATTHGFVALAAATLSLPVVSEYVAAPVALTVAFLGGVAPDADLAAVHRRTLHFPALGSVAAVAAVGLAVLVPSPWTVGPALFLGGAALHAVSDVLGGSAEHEPWDPTTERGVYNHLLGRWHRPRRLVRYSGAPEDLAVAAPFAAVGLLSAATGPRADAAVLALLAGSAGYVLVRRRLGAIAAVLRGALPRSVRSVAAHSDTQAAAASRGEEHADRGD